MHGVNIKAFNSESVYQPMCVCRSANFNLISSIQQPVLTLLCAPARFWMVEAQMLISEFKTDNTSSLCPHFQKSCPWPHKLHVKHRY